jgi:cell pole-organizing protein PopZ
MDTTTAARLAFPKTEPQITNAPAAARTEVDSRARPDLPITPAASGRSDADYPRLRNNAAEFLAAREASHPPDGAESLLPGTAAAVGAALDALARRVAAQSPRSLEDVVRDTLRPMLKAWLDDNLPQLVERLVRAEIERISRGRF